MYFASESEACQLVWELLQSATQEGSLSFVEGDVFWRLFPSQAEAKLREPTSELVLEPSLQAKGFVWSQLFVVVGVAEVLLESSPNVVGSLQNAWAKVFVALHDYVVVVVL